MHREILFHQNLPDKRTGIDLLGKLVPYVRHCGDSYRQRWHMNSRRLLDYLAVYIASGQGYMVIEGKHYSSEKHDLFLIPPDVDHEMAGTSEKMHCVFVHFDLLYDPQRVHWDFSIPGGLRDLSPYGAFMHPSHPFTEITEIPHKITGIENVRLGSILSEVCRESDRDLPYSQLVTSSLMLSFLALLLRSSSSGSSEVAYHSRRLLRSAELMREHPESFSSIEELAGRAGLSASRFRTLFRQLFGYSPSEYLLSMKIKKAKGYMLDTDLSLSQIAELLGYSTVQNFSRAFFKSEGIRPSQWRDVTEGLMD